MSVNRKSIVHMLKAIHQNGSNSNSDSIIKFIPIFNSPYDSNKIGIDIDGYWCIASDERIWSPRNVDDFYVFYCLLYSSLSEVVGLIIAGAEAGGLPPKIAYTFPFDDLLLSALRSSSHWAGLAYKWVEQGYPLNDEMRLHMCNNDKQSKLWLDWQQERLRPIVNM